LRRDIIPAQSRVFGAIDDVIVLARLRCLLTRRFVRVCALAGLVLLTGVARGDVEVWSSIGPNGGTVFALAIDPHAPATIYAGTGWSASRGRATFSFMESSTTA
jgi:hypothetical protein